MPRCKETRWDWDADSIALVSEAEYETGGSAASASNTASETKLPVEDIVPNLINREFTLMKLNFAS